MRYAWLPQCGAGGRCARQLMSGAGSGIQPLRRPLSSPFMQPWQWQRQLFGRCAGLLVFPQPALRVPRRRVIATSLLGRASQGGTRAYSFPFPRLVRSVSSCCSVTLLPPHAAARSLQAGERVSSLLKTTLPGGCDAAAAQDVCACTAAAVAAAAPALSLARALDLCACMHPPCARRFARARIRSPAPRWGGPLRSCRTAPARRARRRHRAHTAWALQHTPTPPTAFAMGGAT